MNNLIYFYLEILLGFQFLLQYLIEIELGKGIGVVPPIVPNNKSCQITFLYNLLTKAIVHCFLTF